MDSPQGDPGQHDASVIISRQHEIDSNQNDQPQRQLPGVADSVGEPAERVGRQGVIMFIATSTSGTSAIGTAPYYARRIRDASLKRASVNTAPMPIYGARNLWAAAARLPKHEAMDASFISGTIDWCLTSLNAAA